MGTSVRVRVTCEETGQVWERKTDWLREMHDTGGFPYHVLKHALRYGQPLSGRHYEERRDTDCRVTCEQVESARYRAFGYENDGD